MSTGNNGEKGRKLGSVEQQLRDHIGVLKMMYEEFENENREADRKVREMKQVMQNFLDVERGAFAGAHQEMSMRLDETYETIRQTRRENNIHAMELDIGQQVGDGNSVNPEPVLPMIRTVRQDEDGERLVMLRADRVVSFWDATTCVENSEKGYGGKKEEEEKKQPSGAP